MEKVNTFEIAIELAKLYIQFSNNQKEPDGPDGIALVEFIREVKQGLDKLGK